MNRPGHQTGKLCGRRDRLTRPLSDNVSRDPPRRPFLAVLPNDVGQFAFAQTIDQIRRRAAEARIESHVERAVVPEAEPTRRVIQLIGREPQVREPQTPNPKPQTPNPSRPNT